MLTNRACHCPAAGRAWGMGRPASAMVAIARVPASAAAAGCQHPAARRPRCCCVTWCRPRSSKCIARHRVTHTFFVPTVVAGAAAGRGGVQGADLSALSCSCTAPPPWATCCCAARWPCCAASFIRPTALTRDLRHRRGVAAADTSPTASATRPAALGGPPYPWVELRVVDPGTLRDAATGAVGEIWVRSRMVMPGLLEQTGRDREAIQPGGWLRTGDAAYLDAPGLHLPVRPLGDLIISGGENIYPAEVENALNGRPAVREGGRDRRAASALGRDSCAPSRAALDRTADAAGLIAWTRERLAPTECRPRCCSPTRCRATPRASCSSASCAAPTGRSRVVKRSRLPSLPAASGGRRRCRCSCCAAGCRLLQPARRIAAARRLHRRGLHAGDRRHRVRQPRHQWLPAVVSDAPVPGLGLTVTPGAGRQRSGGGPGSANTAPVAARVTAWPALVGRGPLPRARRTHGRLHLAGGLPHAAASCARAVATH